MEAEDWEDSEEGEDAVEGEDAEDCDDTVVRLIELRELRELLEVEDFDEGDEGVERDVGLRELLEDGVDSEDGDEAVDFDEELLEVEDFDEGVDAVEAELGELRELGEEAELGELRELGELSDDEEEAPTFSTLMSNTPAPLSRSLISAKATISSRYRCQSAPRGCYLHRQPRRRCGRNRSA